MSSIFILLFAILLHLNLLINAFNVDTRQPSYSYGPNGSYFGFATAQHFASEHPVLLVGAPRADSLQPGTENAGAVFACSASIGRKERNCRRLQVEYPTDAEFRRPPHELNSKPLHREGKNHQLLGFAVQSTGQKHGSAMVCAPLLRYGEQAYTDGACYLLSSELNHTGVISPCNPLEKKDRHNDYGACEQGFSAYIDEHMILTGLPGARKWTGGVFGRFTSTTDIFPITVDRWTMEVAKAQGGIINLLASHDYLGYSVRYGSFGFWFEGTDKQTVTVVSGATRFMQTGAVVFLPFRKSSTTDERILGLDHNFTLAGTQLGSGFGHTVEVLDLNNDGFDDLIVGAPYEFHLAEDDSHYGGAVYVYYSNGKRQRRTDNSLVFREPIVLRGRGVHSQFGVALAKLGNIDNDPSGFQDFAIGAPYADKSGVVFIYHGGRSETFAATAAQEIHSSALTDTLGRPLRTFGSAIAGNVDLDGNGYADLTVGAHESDTVVTFFTRPVIDVSLGHALSERHVKIDGRTPWCPRIASTCFSVTTSLSVLERSVSELRDVRDDPFLCTLKVVPYRRSVATRAIFKQTNRTILSWPCGKNALRNAHTVAHEVYIPSSNQDWVSPLRFNFTVSTRDKRSAGLTPVVNEQQSQYSFDVSFDKKCGEDNDCHTDLVLRPLLVNMTRNSEGKFVTKVTERDSIVVRFMAENRKERAYLAKLWVWYNEDELDRPRLTGKNSGLDIERHDEGLAVVALGNPMEERSQLTFDLTFNLVRGSSERVSASLVFDALVNSTSVEDLPKDNQWRAEVQLIKEADLQLDGVSRPGIIRFSRGNRIATDEEDIGPQVIHAYTITNHGPFYAKNVTVQINWPLKLNSKSEDWVLYTLEEPLIRHRGEVRQCKMHPSLKSINPLGIYNDETQKLTYGYSRYALLGSSGRQKREATNTTVESIDNVRVSSIFDSQYIRPKEVEEASGAKVRIVDVNCNDNTAICYPLTCHFDYIGTRESAMIEIRARLWNYTFSGDYKRIEYVAITSNGHVEVDPHQGIIEDLKNNFASVTTHAYPDRPLQQERIDWWIIVLAILVGLLLLTILIFICWRCGFFKRKRPQDRLLHQAQYSYQHELSYT